MLSKCKVQGKWVGHVILLEACSPLRSDKYFRNKTQEGHHTGTSILDKLDIDMISVFEIDYMHCVCLGVMRKILRFWIRAPFYKNGSSKYDLISDALMNINDFIPSEISFFS